MTAPMPDETTTREPSEAEVKAAARALAHAFYDHWFGPAGAARGYGVWTDHINGEMAWLKEARAALRAAAHARAEGK